MIPSAAWNGSNGSMHQLSIPSRTLGASARGFARARPSTTAAIHAALFAGTVVLLVLEFIGIVAYDESAWKLLRMVAAMARGPGALEPDDEFDFPVVAIGLTLFYAISALYGLAIACILTETPRRHAAVVGIAFGLALYAANFHGFTAIFPWFAANRTIDTLIAHALYGLLLARAYCAFHGE
ncbi:MAG TPA: hypothetical protein VM051_01750 [Usitatibacter sp.]|nr:hypothetical protein [Usitatibacter sp.]